MPPSVVRRRTHDLLPLKRRWTPEDAREVLARLEASGLRLCEFAKREGIDDQRLYRWRAQLGPTDERTASILTIVATCVSYGVNPRAYLHLVTLLIVNRWPHAKLRELLPERLAITHPDLLLRDGAYRSPLLGPAQNAPATTP
jgi:hypothetical protein